MSLRHLVLVLGDQLDGRSAAFEGFDSDRDALWMSETPEETEHVWCHKLRIAFFLSAMRHFRDAQRKAGNTVHYHEMSAERSKDRGKRFAEVLAKDVRALRPQKLVLVEPGDYRVREQLREAAKSLGLELEEREDRSFFCSIGEFRDFAKGKKSLLQETFYRWMRKRHRILLDERGRPEGGEWNTDAQNRETFGRAGPGKVKPPRAFRPDRTTRAVLEMVGRRFADHPGSLETFDLPVTRAQAAAALKDFVEHRLRDFGRYEDAMWSGQPFLYHSRLSAALNVKLLLPCEAIDAAIAALRAKAAPLNSVEGFVRQILGWREFVRGVYWLQMPDYATRNGLDARRELPRFFWDGETDLACVREAMHGVIDHAYAHHIQRLMVLGNLAMLYGAHPAKFNDWHMAMYADAVDWASVPNALGMSQHADGGVVGTKPYCASGKYVQRMSNYCGSCRYDPAKAAGEEACPITTLYWAFLDRHRKAFARNPRMGFQVRNLERKGKTELDAIRSRAETLHRKWSARAG